MELFKPGSGADPANAISGDMPGVIGEHATGQSPCNERGVGDQHQLYPN